MSKLIYGFVAIIIGVVLIGVIANNGLAVSQRDIITAEAINIEDTWMAEGQVNSTINFTLAQAPEGWKQGDCPVESFVLRNTTNVSDDALTVTTDYVLTASTGVFYLMNTTDVNASFAAGGDNLTYAHYTYCEDGYMNIGWGRTIIDLIAGFFALAIMGAGIGLFYSVAKETGML